MTRETTASLSEVLQICSPLTKGRWEWSTPAQKENEIAMNFENGKDHQTVKDINILY